LAGVGKNKIIIPTLEFEKDLSTFI